jgi:hypothetical protein
MKTTDGYNIIKGKWYYIIRDNKIVRERCTFYRKWSSYAYFHKSYSFETTISAKGKVYLHKINAQKRLLKILKDDVKFHKNEMNRYSDLTENIKKKIGIK